MKLQVLKPLTALVVTTALMSQPNLGLAAAKAKSVPIVTISSEGGFVAPGTNQSSLPSLLALNSGTGFTPSDSAQRPDILAALKHSLPTQRLFDLVVQIGRAANKPPGGWGYPGVADVPNTRIKIALPKMHRNLSVFALNFFNGETLTPVQVRARKRLAAAVNALEKFVDASKSTRYSPDIFEVWDRSAIQAGLEAGGAPGAASGGGGLANPASVFCTSSGGTLKIEDSPAGQQGICTLPNGSKMEEWAYFRKLGPLLEQWPSSLSVPTKICNTVSAKKFATELARNNKSGRWLLPTGEVRYLTLRPLLPGEIACHRG